MGIFDYFRTETRKNNLKAEIVQELTESIVKASNANTPGVIAASPNGAKRYSFSQELVNGTQTKKKPGSNINFDTLRRFSVAHEITRACINARKRHISGLKWDIVTADTEDTDTNEKAVKEIKAWFKKLGGNGLNYRLFINRLVEDLLVLDAISLEKQLQRGGKLENLIPIDAATIRLRVDQAGGTPLPPEVAYKQIIRGKVTATWTSEEMIYGMMNPRNDTPYGLAPLESLIIIVSSSLKAGTYNLAYLTEGNIPEGFMSVPESWTPQMIKEYQEMWDAMLGGDEGQLRSMKFTPGGSGAGYTPTKKPSDMAFKEFNDWLLKITCALFDVQPQEIGFTPQNGLGGKGIADSQDDITNRKAIKPMVEFIEELFTEIIQIDLGYPDLAFKYQGLEKTDAKLDAEVNEILIRSGQRTIDEIRTDDGLAPLGVDKPFVMGQPTFIDAESLEAKAELAESIQENTTKDEPTEDKEEPEEDTEKRHLELIDELRTFRKYALNRMEKGKAIRPFESNVLTDNQINELNLRIQKSKDKSEIRAIFKEYMDDYNIQMVKNVIEVRKKITELL